jgi:hypothetical protein
MGNHNTDQKKQSQGTDKDGPVNQHRPAPDHAVGSHKPGGDGPGTKRVHHDHDDRETRK